jgi:hypothetical protein
MRAHILLAAIVAAGCAGQRSSVLTTDEAKNYQRDLEPKLGVELAKALVSCPQLLTDALAFEGRDVRAEEVETLRKEYRKVLAAAATATPRPGAEALNDAFLVYAAQGARVMDAIIVGGAEREKAWKTGQLTLGDLKALQADAGMAAGVTTPGADASAGIPQSGGINGSLSAGQSGVNFGLAITYSKPLSRAVDYGGELSMTVAGGAFSSMGRLNIRYNFLSNGGTSVPYLGASGGYPLYPSNGAVSLALDAGMLFFMSRSMALNINLRLDPLASITGASIFSSTIGFRVLQ